MACFYHLSTSGQYVCAASMPRGTQFHPLKPILRRCSTNQHQTDTHRPDSITGLLGATLSPERAHCCVVIFLVLCRAWLPEVTAAVSQASKPVYGLTGVTPPAAFKPKSKKHSKGIREKAKKAAAKTD